MQIRLNTIGKYLVKTKCKWETKVRRGLTPSKVSWKQKCKMIKWIESRNSNIAVVAVSVGIAVVTELI
jgi:hypothetical protein